jgi:regulatory protein
LPSEPASKDDALQRGLRFLSYRPRSEAEVLNYLIGRGYSHAVAENVVEKLRSLNYVKDENFARNWARSRFETRGYGPKRIEQELRTKGVEPSLIREVLRETFAQHGETKKAKILLAKRFQNKKFDDPKMVRRAIAFLQRRGYSNKVIFDLLKYPVEND